MESGRVQNLSEEVKSGSVKRFFVRKSLPKGPDADEEEITEVNNG
jgi:hypothetical protein